MSGKKKNKKIAFTLIELLIALTIFSVAASVLYSSFRLGILSWKRSEDILKRYQRIRYAINRLSDDITNTFMYKNIVFKGGENHIEFAGLVRGPDAKQKIPGRISYDFSKNTSSILRKEQPYWQAIKEEQAEGAGEELISGVVELNISYCYQEKDSEAIAWFDEWLSEEKIPAGVKLELIIKDDYSPQGQIIFSKRINIPVGELIGMEELKND